LKLSFTSRISLGPSRGSGCGKTPRPSSRAYSLSFARGSIKRLVRSTVNRAQMSSIPANQNIQLAPNLGFSAVRSARIQYSSPSISKLTHKPGMPFRLWARMVFLPKEERTLSRIRSLRLSLSSRTIRSYGSFGSIVKPSR